MQSVPGVPQREGPEKDEPVLQGMFWTYIDGAWYADDDTTTNPTPTRAGTNGERFDDGLDAEPVAAADPYAAAVVLADGTTVDYPALIAVMDDVTIGEQVASSVWRKMRQDLSAAITMANKSHPAHGSNFDKKQRPEQQIKDWATPIQGELKKALTTFFSVKYSVDL